MTAGQRAAQQADGLGCDRTGARRHRGRLHQRVDIDLLCGDAARLQLFNSGDGVFQPRFRRMRNFTAADRQQHDAAAPLRNQRQQLVHTGVAGNGVDDHIHPRRFGQHSRDDGRIGRIEHDADLLLPTNTDQTAHNVQPGFAAERGVDVHIRRSRFLLRGDQRGERVKIAGLHERQRFGNRAVQLFSDDLNH